MEGPLFEVHHLGKIFPDGFQVLSDINLTIPRGTCMVLAGANGSGKTILMKHLVGLLEPTEGTIYYQGKPISGKGASSAIRKKLRHEVGFVFQDADAQIIGETVGEDVRFGPKNLGYTGKDVENRVKEVLEKLGLWEKKEVPPRHLSGGEKRRLAIAGILAMGCHTIIMDEPFANLDYPGVMQVLETLVALRSEGKTLIICTHELQKLLPHAERLVVIYQGRVQIDGAPAQVLDQLDPRWGIRDPRHRYTNITDCTWLR
ncbi:MAG: energy-coupling factor ABC transporter ATP-binding protein [Treponemataceae bacterium]|nr:energy-coupling factor ABC transporter ATP-binding protein [Treponemataceae bacterium]